jgi:hypothetical protein
LLFDELHGGTDTLADRALQVARRTELGGVDQQEAARAHELVGLLGLDTVSRLAHRSGGLLLELFVLVVVLVGGDAVLQDGVEVGLDVVGIGLFLVVFFLVALLASLGRGFDRDRLVFFLVGVDVVLRQVGVDQSGVLVVFFDEDLLLVDLVDGEGLVELLVVDVVVSHVVLRLGPRPVPRPG